MNINLPDPDIGRCPNLRPDAGKPGSYLRCLKLAGHHVCSFDPPTKPVAYVLPGMTQPQAPKPWVERRPRSE